MRGKNSKRCDCDRIKGAVEIENEGRASAGFLLFLPTQIIDVILAAAAVAIGAGTEAPPSIFYQYSIAIGDYTDPTLWCYLS